MPDVSSMKEMDETSQEWESDKEGKRKGVGRGQVPEKNPIEKKFLLKFWY